MTVGVLATLRVREGQEQAFEAAFAELAAAVRRNEPDNSLYTLFRSRTEPRTYHVMEIYASDQALAAHGKSEHFRAIGAKLGPALAGAPDIQTFDSV